MKQELKMKIAKITGGVAACAALMLAGCSGQGANTENSVPNGNATNNGNGADAASNGATNAATSGIEPKAVTIGYLPNIVLPQPLIGFQEGEFTRRINGVAFHEKTFPAGPAVLEALRADVVQIAYTGPYPPIKAFVKDGDVILLGGCATGGTALMVSKNSPITTVAQLKGKTVAVNQIGSTVDALVRHNLIKAGLSPNSDVKIVAIEPAQQADALKAGEADAVAAPAPWPSYVQLKGGGRALLDDKQILDNGNYLQGVYYTTKRFVQANPNFVKRFVEVNREITTDLNKNRAKADARVLNAWQKASKKKLDPNVAKAAFATIQFTSDADLTTLTRDLNIAVETGALKKKGDLNGFVYNPNVTP